MELEKLKNEKEALERAYKATLDECEKLTNQRVRKVLICHKVFN
jgi:hypothetical protein